MSEIPEVFTNMLAAWNERDFDKIRGFIDKSLAENVVFADPTNFTKGRDDFEEMVKEFRTKYPEAVCRRTSNLDTHNNRYRYTWDIKIGEKTVLKGIDFVQLNEDGLVKTVDGFFGDLVPLDS